MALPSLTAECVGPRGCLVGMVAFWIGPLPRVVPYVALRPFPYQVCSLAGGRCCQPRTASAGSGRTPRSSF